MLQANTDSKAARWKMKQKQNKQTKEASKH